MSAEAIPGLPSVDIDDVVVKVEELPGSLIARAVVHEGMLSGLYVWAEGLTDYPRHLTFTDVRYRQRDGRDGPLRDPRLLDEFERQLAPSFEVQPAPDWLRELVPAALRPSPRSSAAVDEVTQSAHPDTAALALWLQAQDLGDVRLLSGSEFFATQEGEVLVANGLDGSAYTVTPQGRVRHYPLDQLGSADLGTLRGWLRRLEEDEE